MFGLALLLAVIVTVPLAKHSILLSTILATVVSLLERVNSLFVALDGFTLTLTVTVSPTLAVTLDNSRDNSLTSIFSSTVLVD